ncbi:MAG: glycosyltransferase family 4 protein [Caldilineales bacterium]|nr:glycosyltransferase family 4 protein [Caldilineales bacterium]MCW5860525.1 glycosyltransferase family 4 protein [Caldilineales bacterium]
MIRIAHLITRFHGAGGAKNTLFTCAGLDKTRFEVDLVVGASADAWRADGAGVNWVQIPSLRRDVHPLADAQAARDLLALCRRRRYHIVHTHLAKAGILGRWAARRAGVPIVLHSLHGATFHDSPARRTPNDWLYYGLERLAAPWTDAFISVGDDLRQRYLRAGVGAPGQYVVIHSGMDLDAFRAAGRMGAEARQAVRASLGYGPETFLAGYVAALEWRKGHRYLVEVLRRLAGQHPQLRLVFVGEGYDRPRIEALVAGAGMGDRVQFTGYRTDVAAVMAAFDVKLFASNREGLPQVLVQAAAVGLPVLAFAAEGVVELVKEGVNGHIFAHGDVAGMAGALESLLRQPDEARRLGAAGPALVDDRWQIATMQAKTQALYDRWLEAKRLP